MSDVEFLTAESSQQEADVPGEPSAQGMEHAAGEEVTTPQAEAEQVQESEATLPEAIEYEAIEDAVQQQAEANELEALRTELEQAQVQAAEYLNGWQRARAEFANYKKRVDAEREDLRRTSNETLLRKLLPVVDDFERAFQTLPEESVDAAWVNGIQMILRKLQAILDSEDVAPIEAAGQPFDPLWHEAVLQEETDEHPDGFVIEEMQRGYRLGRRVLRPSMVKVASNKNESNNESA